ncbi:MAG: hypothetical protein L6R48_01520 [Planctomycetes bacterium]|nr:hypothetical protein [Planctomycetota bacterium]
MITHGSLPFRRNRSPRSGTALILALGVVAMVAALILLSSEGAIYSHKQASAGQDHLKVQAALEAVLARREQRVIQLAEAGDPSQFAEWSNNYGLEYFGECEVRWKVEPVRSAPKDASGNTITFLANPSPDINWEPPSTFKLTSAPTTDAWRSNDTIYLFRVAAEARLCTDDGSNKTIEGDTRARAQGARYVSVNKEPLFRYVIFYAQKGVKGDLELSHGPAIKVFGNVHSNGSIYLGASTETNDWNAVRPTNGDTYLGPMEWNSTTTYVYNDRVRFYDSGTSSYTSYVAKNIGGNLNKTPPTQTSYWSEIKDARVRVTGVDGIFRLAKPAMYGFFGGFPMKNPGWAPASATTSHYSLIFTGTPLDAQDGPVNSTLAAATFNGGFVNPYRVTSDSKLVTSPATQLAADDTKRQINGTAITGNWQTPDSGNDARDKERTTNLWLTASQGNPPNGFSGFARTKVTGAQVKQLPETLANRPLEAQAVLYPDLSSLPSTSAQMTAWRERGDDHTAALPLFITDSAGSTTTAYTATLASAPSGVIESPGQYVRYALGSNDFYFQRVMANSATDDYGFIGWKATAIDGTAVPASALPAKVGLIIRERPVPDFRYFGKDATGGYLPDRTSASADFVPYAYGKHKDITLWPFTEMFVSSMPGTANPSTYNTKVVHGIYSEFINNVADKTVHNQTYTRNPVLGGVLTVTTAVRRGGDGKSAWNRDASYSGNDVANEVSQDPFGFYRDNWRVIHLKRTRANVSNNTGPVVDMTKADNYFSKADFTSVQTRLVPDATGKFLTPVDASGQPQWTAPNYDPLAGLMVRPINRAAAEVTTTLNLSTNALNGRDPYVALCYSPERGIVLQRRFERSVPKSVTIAGTNRYFTGKGDPLSADDATKIGSLQPGNVCIIQDIKPATGSVYGASAVNTNVANTYTDKIVSQGNDATGAVDSGTACSLPAATISTGEGPVARPAFSLVRGPYEIKKFWKFRKESRTTWYRNRTSQGYSGYEDWTLSGHNVNFQQSMTAVTTPVTAATWANGWTGKTIWIDPTFGGGYAANPTASAKNWTLQNLSAPSGTYTSVSFNPGQGFISNTTYRIPIWANDGGATYTPSSHIVDSYGTPKSYPQTNSPWSDGSSAVVFTNLGSYAAAKTWYTSKGLTETQLQNDIKAAVSGVTSFAARATPPTFSQPANPTDLANTTAITAPAAVTAATLTLTASNPAALTGSRKVAILHDGSSATYKRIETNSYISARGTWAFGTPVLMQVLTPSTASLANFTWLSSQYLQPNLVTTLPTTRSFPPMVYTGPLSGLPTSALASAPAVAPWTTWTTSYMPPTLTPFQPTEADGSIVFRSDGYNGSNDTALYKPFYNTGTGTAATTDASPGPGLGTYNSTTPVNPPFWEDAQIPRWGSSSISYRANSSTVAGSLVWYNGDIYECTANHTSTVSPTPPTNPNWAKVTILLLRIEKDSTGFIFKYFASTSAPTGGTDARWRTVAAGATRTAGPTGDGMPTDFLTSADSAIPAAWSTDWIVGPCVQSNAYLPNPWDQSSNSLKNNCRDRRVQVKFAGLQVETASADSTNKVNPATTLNNADWEASAALWVHASATTAGRLIDNLTSYLCSQYQVFWGPLDITEDFFSYTKASSGADADRIASENWFYNTRFFWSQSRWWNEGDLDSSYVPLARSTWVEKETGTTTNGSYLTTVERERLARTTVLDINLVNLQDYLKNRTLPNAAYKWSTNSYQGVNPLATDLLKNRFSGLIYAARYNRYPRNPTPSTYNPWNPDLPNQTSVLSNSNLVPLAYAATASYTAPATDKTALTNRLVAVNSADRGKLQAPIPWEDFHHGIMLSNGDAIDWGWVSTSTKFGTGKTSIVTPNSLYVKGNLNNTQKGWNVKGTDNTPKWTPLAIMGDNVTLLSNSWTYANYQRAGIGTIDDGRVTDSTTLPLARVSGFPVSLDTQYRTCILTNNQPTTKYRVFNGEGAPFVNTMLFMEDWGNPNRPTTTRTMDYTGSLVVMDSCRYTRAYLLAEARTAGRSPYGLMGWHCNTGWSALTGWGGGDPDWCRSGTTALPSGGAANSATAPYGSLPVYWPPNRNMTFNDDLLTEEGTPPNTPFGVTASGVGGWTRVVQ